MNNHINDAVLLLEDGHIFRGKSFGKKGTVVGNISFNAGVTGYQEVMTDPSNKGQLLIMSASHIGNYGVQEGDLESKDVQIKGLIAKQIARKFSRMTAKVSMKEYLEEQEMVAIENIDTRALISHLRDSKKTLKGIISSEDKSIEELKELIENYSQEDLYKDTQYKAEEEYFYGIENSKYRIAVIDYGLKRGILDALAKRNAYLKVFDPAKTDLEAIQAFKAQGVLLSNGPGNPEEMEEKLQLIEAIKSSGIPIFGIGLGFQLLAKSYGIPISPLGFASRGANHPVIHLDSKKCEITAQNHSYKICADTLEKHSELVATHKNLNDAMIVGFKHKSQAIFGVVYHPESKPGTHDSQYLFDDFLKNIDTHTKS